MTSLAVTLQVPEVGDLYDLFPLHVGRVREGQPSLHPLRWLRRQRDVILFFHGDLDDRGQTKVQFGERGPQLTCHHALRAAVENEKVYRGAGYYFGSRYVAEEYLSSSPSGQHVETALVDALVVERDVTRVEHPSPVGRVDLISENELIEVKCARLWKHGLGQLLAYAHYENRPKRILYTFDPTEAPKGFDRAREVCTALGVELVFRKFG